MNTRQLTASQPSGASAASFTPMRCGVLQRKCACGGSPGPAGDCSQCRKKRLQRQSARAGQLDSVPPIVHEVLGSPGRRLAAHWREWFGSRMGHDFSKVRIHADPKAADSARAVQATAYTVGQHVAFASGGYAPHTATGRQLLAHELVHTRQQGQVADWRRSPLEIGPPGDGYERQADHVAQQALTQPGEAKMGVGTAGPSLQRDCGSRAIGRPEGCNPFGGVSITDISSRLDERFLFVVDCDNFDAGQQANLEALAARVGPDDVIDIHGFASEEGDADYNEHLACARARKAESVLIAEGVPQTQIRALYKHGATPGPRPENRSVIIPLAEPPEIEILEAGFVGPPSESQRRAAVSCPIDCDGRNLGTMHAMALFYHASRTGIVPQADPTATGVGASLHFTATAVNIPSGDACHCDEYKIIQVVDRTHPPAGRANPGVDNAGRATPFYGDVFTDSTGTGIHEIPTAAIPDAGERIQSTRSLYDLPYLRSARWEAEACVACVKNGQPDRILGCATYGYTRALTPDPGDPEPIAAIGPGCGAAPSNVFMDGLRNDPTVSAYDFEGR